MDHKELQKSLRKKILEICHKVKSGHIACSLSCIDLIIAIMILYKKIMKILFCLKVTQRQLYM